VADYTWTVNLRTVNEANARDHWCKVHKRVKAQRQIAKAYTKQQLGHVLATDRPKRVHMVRIAPKALDSDGLVSSMKAVRDGIADAYGCDDSEAAGIEWTYGQEPHGKPRLYAVRVEVSL